MNATEVLERMYSSVRQKRVRRVSELQSPQRGTVFEAPLFTQFVLTDLHSNLPRNASVSVKWLYANTLHFFSGTEYAPLRRYNCLTEKFAPGSRWIGAYGYIAMPQVRECVRVLNRDAWSRRAVVSMGGPEPSDLNRPACWSHLHFLFDGELHMHVYQRSLNLAIMPYDCVLLSNLLMHVAEATRCAPGRLHWTVGSAHCREDFSLNGSGTRDGVVFRYEHLFDPRAVIDWLVLPELAPAAVSLGLLSEERT